MNAESRTALADKLAALRTAYDHAMQMNRFTAFSGWYKGDHGKAHRALGAAIRDAIKAADIFSSDETGKILIAELDAALEMHRAKNGADYHISKAVAFEATLRE